ncbi:hypothetical protein CPB86DRAFT_412495 [Serendipita vermifera]|nr:hypothetical protein CPB86DRAFT_412495 [Serendipita vermifera]
MVDEDHMRIRIRVVWGQTPSGGPNNDQNQVLAPQERYKGSSGDTEFQLMRVYYDKNEWRARDEALLSGLTPDMVSLLTMEGCDIIESS